MPSPDEAQQLPPEMVEALRTHLAEREPGPAPIGDPSHDEPRPADQPAPAPIREPDMTLSPAGEGEVDRGDAPGPAEGERIEPGFFDKLQASLAAEKPGPTPAPAPEQPQRIQIPAALLLAMIEHGIAGQEQFIANLGVGIGAIIDFHINRAVLLIAGIESPVSRGQIVDGLQKNIAREVDNAFLRLHQTPGGIVIPPKGMELPPAPGAN